MPDILERIIDDRRRDLSRLGPAMGTELPSKRKRPLVPFLHKAGAILEIKRASPSKGPIALDLDPASLAASYARAGAKNISVLTEQNYFKGSLGDLMQACEAQQGLSFLRKDFLLSEDEIEISHRAGADAVLLIARILDEKTLRDMAEACRSLGMTAFIELREKEDIAKVQAAAGDGKVLCGVNARDLSTFKIDSLAPAALLASLPGPAVYESGIESSGSAAYARRLGFKGILVGEAATRNPDGARAIVAGFLDAQEDGVGSFWRRIAMRTNAERRSALGARPLVKICGLARPEDALLASELGADLLGFVFAESPRAATCETVQASVQLLKQHKKRKHEALRIGVITELDSSRAREAIGLARQGLLDAIQWHGKADIESLRALDSLLSSPREDGQGATKPCAGRYAAARVGSEEDLAAMEELQKAGEPRVLADARVEGSAGGSGKSIDGDLAAKLAQKGGLWLAGGLSAENVGSTMDRYGPELLDASSKLELDKGRKDIQLMKKYFREIEKHAKS